MPRKSTAIFSQTIQEGRYNFTVIHPDGQQERLQRRYRRLQLVDKNLVIASEDDWRVLPAETIVEIS